MTFNRGKDYYENNKELLRERERAKSKYRELPEEEKNIKREYGKKRYNMSEENKKIRISKTCFRNANVSIKTFFVRSFINF